MVATLGEVSVETLAHELGASPETIRRDLSVLEDAGKLLKIHGGAKQVPQNDEGPFYARMKANLAEKRAIADKLSAWLQGDQMVFLDTGSTTLIAAEALVRKNSLKIVTNSLKIAGLLAAKPDGPKVFMLGGWVEGDNSETIGSATVTEINRFNADYAIITAGTICPKSGVCDFSFDEAEIARAMTRKAKRTVILADASKLGRRAAYPVCALAEIDILISNALPSAKMRDALSQARVQVL